MNINKILKNLNEPTINKDFFYSKNKKKELKKAKKIQKNNVKKIIEKFKKDEIKNLKTLNIEDCKKMLTFANKEYTNYEPIMNNILYDILKKYILNSSDNYDKNLSKVFLNNYKTK